jgi:hypothetical protein
MMFVGLLGKQGVIGSIPVTSTIYLPANQSVANSDFARRLQFGSNKKPLHTFHCSALLRWDRVQINLPCNIWRFVAQECLRGS